MRHHICTTWNAKNLGFTNASLSSRKHVIVEAVVWSREGRKGSFRWRNEDRQRCSRRTPDNSSFLASFSKHTLSNEYWPLWVTLQSVTLARYANMSSSSTDRIAEEAYTVKKLHSRTAIGGNLRAARGNLFSGIHVQNCDKCSCPFFTRVLRAHCLLRRRRRNHKYVAAQKISSTAPLCTPF